MNLTFVRLSDAVNVPKGLVAFFYLHLRHPIPVVAHLAFKDAAHVPSDLEVVGQNDLNFAALLFVELYRVGQNVEDHLLESGAVTHHKLGKLLNGLIFPD